MSMTGTWIITEARRFDEEKGLVWKRTQDLLADDTIDDSDKKMLKVKYIFDGEGTVMMVMPIPEGTPQEDIDAAVATGEVELYGGNMFVMEKKAYKEEDGKVYMDTGIKGEILGENINPWEELKVVPDIPGCYEIFFNRIMKES